MLRNYVGEHQDDWYVYVGRLTYAYNSHVHRTTGTTPFELLLSRPPSEFPLRRAEGDAPPPDRGTQRAEFLRTLDASIQKAYVSLHRARARYKCDFDMRIRRINSRLRPSEYVYINATNGVKTSNTLTSPAVGPYHVLVNDRRTITIDRDRVTERVSADRCVYVPPPMGSPRASTATPGDLADKVTAGTQYAAERLLRHRTMEDGTTEFLIKWADYGTPTWTARTNIPEELVSRYDQRLGKRTGRDLNSDVDADVHA